MDGQDTLLQVIKQLSETNSKQHEEITSLRMELQRLSAQIAWFTRQMFGRKSEKLGVFDPNQLALNFEGQQVDLIQQDVALEAAREVAESEIAPMPSRQENKTERKNRKLLENLPVVEIVLEPEGIDHEKYIRIGEEHTKTLEFEPGKLYVKDIIRPKYGLRSSTDVSTEKGKGVLIAPLPLLPLYKGLPGATLLSEILIRKYVYHVPFYRQIQQFKHLGVNLAESTLNGWFKPVCEILRPLYDKVKEIVIATDYLQVDETTLPVINKEKHMAAKEYLWMVRSVMKNMVFFHYDDGSRSGKVIGNLLKDFKGYLQSDGYQGYNVFQANGEVCLVGCLAHCRRRFSESLEENKTLAEYALGQIQLLYKIERNADDQKITHHDRALMRQRLSIPILDALEKWLEVKYKEVLPKSRMGEAISYVYSLMPRLKVYTRDGRLRIDNNAAENAIRPIALARKNFLFCGDNQAAEYTAIISSLLGCCKAADVNPRDWLIDTLNRLPYYTQPKSGKDLKELLPAYWAESNEI
ncbi:transposase [Bacteroidia bacterium]|nr:transposase [Bacteroidia bacterium]